MVRTQPGQAGQLGWMGSAGRRICCRTADVHSRQYLSRHGAMIASVDSREVSRIVASAILPLRRVSSICHVDVDSAVRIWDYAFGSFPAAFSARVNQAVAAIAIGVGDIDGEWW